MRDFIVAGNWKMNGDAQLVDHFLEGLSHASFPAAVEVVLCPPAVYLGSFGDAAARIGAQNCSSEASGAFTGELSVEMLQDVGCKYVLVGHSERRALFGETDSVVAQKVKTVSDSGLLPILCVGETLEERQSGDYLNVVSKQVVSGLSLLDKKQTAAVVLAYEPVWAIGTGLTATPEQAQEVHASIRQVLETLIDEDISRKVKILYGGSVNAGNAAELFAQQDIDGGLVGGASLKFDEFMAICSAAAKLV